MQPDDDGDEDGADDDDYDDGDGDDDDYDDDYDYDDDDDDDLHVCTFFVSSKTMLHKRSRRLRPEHSDRRLL